MKTILNFFLILLVFYIGNKCFPEYIYIEDTKTLIIATLFMFVLSWLYGLLLLTSVLSIIAFVGCLTTPILILFGIFLTPIKLLLLTNFLPGFTIHGFWTYVLLTVCLSIFSFSTSKSKK